MANVIVGFILGTLFGAVGMLSILLMVAVGQNNKGRHDR